MLSVLTVAFSVMVCLVLHPSRKISVVISNRSSVAVLRGEHLIGGAGSGEAAGAVLLTGEVGSDEVADAVHLTGEVGSGEAAGAVHLIGTAGSGEVAGAVLLTGGVGSGEVAGAVHLVDAAGKGEVAGLGSFFMMLFGLLPETYSDTPRWCGRYRVR